MNEFDQSKVAYETGPKETPDNKGMSGERQFPGDKMPQGNKMQVRKGSPEYIERKYPANPSLNRYIEYR